MQWSVRLRTRDCVVALAILWLLHACAQCIASSNDEVYFLDKFDEPVSSLKKAGWISSGGVWFRSRAKGAYGNNFGLLLADAPSRHCSIARNLSRPVTVNRSPSSPLLVAQFTMLAQSGPFECGGVFMRLGSLSFGPVQCRGVSNFKVELNGVDYSFPHTLAMERDVAHTYAVILDPFANIVTVYRDGKIVSPDGSINVRDSMTVFEISRWVVDVEYSSPGLLLDNFYLGSRYPPPVHLFVASDFEYFPMVTEEQLLAHPEWQPIDLEAERQRILEDLGRRRIFGGEIGEWIRENVWATVAIVAFFLAVWCLFWCRRVRRRLKEAVQYRASRKLAESAKSNVPSNPPASTYTAAAKSTKETSERRVQNLKKRKPKAD